MEDLTALWKIFNTSENDLVVDQIIDDFMILGHFVKWKKIFERRITLQLVEYFYTRFDDKDF